MFRTDGKRADGLTLTSWSRGRSLVWDATCVDTMCKTYVPITARTAGAVPAKAEKEKRDLYALLPHQYQFLPFAVETIGPFGDDALKFVRQLGGRLRSATGEPRETARQFKEATQPAWWLLFPQNNSPNPKIHSTNNTLILSPFVTEWRLSQKCVLDIGMHFTL
jgi:hypothetical protein